MPKKPPSLSERQKRFAEFVVAGKPPMVAYELAGYAGGSNAHKNAHRLTANEGVKAHISRLSKPRTENAVATRQRKREILLEVMEGKRKGATVADSIRAIQTDNLMTGDNQPIKVEGEITLKRILDEISGDGTPGAREDE